MSLYLVLLFNLIFQNIKSLTS